MRLKPCPFCGAIPIIIWQDWGKFGDCYKLKATHEKECYFRCMDGMNMDGTMSSFNKQSLIIAWNRRTPESCNKTVETCNKTADDTLIANNGTE